MLLVPDVPQTTNTVFSPGTDTLMLGLATNPLVLTNQIKYSPSTRPAGSIINNSWKLIEHYGALVTMKGNKGLNVVR